MLHEGLWLWFLAAALLLLVYISLVGYVSKTFEVMDRVGDKRERSREEALDDHSKRQRSAAATEELDVYISNRKGKTFSAETMIDLISKKGADPNHRCGYDHFTPLMALSSLGRGRVDDRLHGEIMKGFRFLLQIPTIDVNLLDEYRNALIQRVVGMEDPAFLTMLLEKRASSEHINKTGMTGLSPLHLACSSRLVSIESIRSLLDKGADPYQPSRTEEGYPPLYYAIKTYGENVNLDMDKLRDILDIFLRHGVDIGRHRGGDGGTIMHVVARYANDARFCTKVLNNGGDRVLDVYNNAGKTPLEVADTLNHDNVVLAIEKFLRLGARAG